MVSCQAVNPKKDANYWKCSLPVGHKGDHRAHCSHDLNEDFEQWSDESPAQVRKTYPMFSGLLKYFPDALMEVAHVSFVGNEQHNPGQPLHWDRSKSTDEPDALLRHLKDAGTLDTDGLRHSAKVAWRALALLQKEIENGTKI